jgi:hypothetical protein
MVGVTIPFFFDCGSSSGMAITVGSNAFDLMQVYLYGI